MKRKQHGDGDGELLEDKRKHENGDGKSVFKLLEVREFFFNQGDKRLIWEKRGGEKNRGKNLKVLW